MLKLSHTYTYHSATSDIHSMLTVTSINFLWLKWCVVYTRQKNNRANATHGPSLVLKMFPDGTEALLD